MIHAFFLISEILTGTMRMAAGFFLASRILGMDRPGKRAVLAGAAGTVILSVVLAVTGAPLSLRIALESLGMTAYEKRSCGADVRQGLFVNIFYEIGFSLWIFLAEAVAKLVQAAAGRPVSAAYSRMAAGWIVSIAAAGLCLYIRRRPDLREKDGFRLASGLAILGFVGTISLSEQSMLAVSGDTLDVWMILSLICMIAILIFRMRRQYEVERELAEVKAEQAELLERDYTELSRLYGANARLFHDFHNHIGVLQRFLDTGKYEEARHYLNELQQPVRNLTEQSWTGDEAADYLIGSKKAEAEAAGIRMRVQVEYPRRANLQSADLCAVLGNLLDNALEAAEKVPEPDQRQVSLTIRRIHRMLVVKVEITFAGKPVEKDGHLVSTKSGQGLHGWGTRSVQAAAEKYDGTVQTSCEGNIFRAVVTLSFPDLREET